jgi:16S rRNA (guanine1207-N2)-methyltransferase
MRIELETLMLVFTGNEGLELPSRGALFLGAVPHEGLRGWQGLVGWQPLKPLADAWDGAGFARVDELPDKRWPLVLLLPGKSRDETLAWFALARDRLEPGGRLVVAMPNTAGAGRFEKELAKATGNISSIQKHKCRAFHAVEDGNWNEETFESWRLLAERKSILETNYLTQDGIFSSDHVDPGSALLARHLPPHLHGSVADLGAGWGYLTDRLLQSCRKVSRVDLFEADRRALECASLNLAHWQAERSAAEEDALLHFHWHDVTTGLPSQYDAIVMNPPFHSGQATDVDLGRAFLKTAISSLKRGGKLFLVANRQLPYEAVLETSGLAWRKPAEDKIYKLLFAEKR